MTWRQPGRSEARDDLIAEIKALGSDVPDDICSDLRFAAVVLTESRSLNSRNGLNPRLVEAMRGMDRVAISDKAFADLAIRIHDELTRRGLSR